MAAALGLQATAGNWAVDSLMARGIVQRKCACESTGSPCPSCAERRENIQRKSTDGGPVAGAISDTVGGVTSRPGAPLNPETQSAMEERFGASFDGVRLHTDSAAGESASAERARAYTYGSHIVFGDGEYNPSTTSGRLLLAHELAHVVQQSRGGFTPVQSATAAHEAAADSAARAAVSGREASAGGGTGVGVARDPKEIDPDYVKPSAQILQVMDQMDGELSALRANAQPAARGPQEEAMRTFCVVKIVGADGKVRQTVTGQFLGKGNHAEQDALSKIGAGSVQSGDTVLVKVDQHPCEKTCESALKTFRSGLPEDVEMRVYVTVKVTEKKGRRVPGSPKVAERNPDKSSQEPMELIEYQKLPGQSHAAPPPKPAKPGMGGKPKAPPKPEPPKGSEPPAETKANDPAPKPVEKPVEKPAEKPVEKPAAREPARTTGEKPVPEPKPEPKRKAFTESEHVSYPDYGSSGTSMKDPYASKPAVIGEELAAVIPEAEQALTDKTIRYGVARMILDRWSMLEGWRQQFPNDTILVAVSLEEWDTAGEAGTGRMINYVEFYHGKDEAEARSGWSSSYHSGPASGWHEVGPFFAVIGPSEPLEVARQAVAAEKKLCFIATACYGTPDAADVCDLRMLRDTVLRRYAAGRAFITAYERHSPPVALFLTRHSLWRGLVRRLLVRPCAAAARSILRETRGKARR